MKVYIENSRFLEGATELAHRIVCAQFGADYVIEESDGADGFKYVEEAQDFFNETLDTVVSTLNLTLEVYSADERDS